MKIATNTIARNIYAYVETRRTAADMRTALIAAKPWDFSDTKKAEIDWEIVQMIARKYGVQPKFAEKHGKFSGYTVPHKVGVVRLCEARRILKSAIVDKKQTPKRKPQLRTRLNKSAQPILDCLLSGDERQTEAGLVALRALLTAARNAHLKV
jgi:hypothetical protein